MASKELPIEKDVATIINGISEYTEATNSNTESDRMQYYREVAKHLTQDTRRMMVKLLSQCK